MQQDAHPLTPLMLEAVSLAEKVKWQTAPNPPVAALLLKDDQVVASGIHEGPGLAHAEVKALEVARAKGVDPRDCTLVVTLEPCTHFGKTPPCTDAVIKSGIRRVVIGARDPNPVAGGGVERLLEEGIQVETGIAGQACQDLLDSFSTWQNTEYPYLILKLASTMDGRIATRNGHSQWITNEQTRGRVHQLRRHMQAIIIGGNTFYQDDPKLTCRIEGQGGDCGPPPLAVIVTSRLPDAGSSSYLLQNRPETTLFWTTVAAAASPKAEALRKLGVRVIGLQSSPRANLRGHGMRAELSLEEGLAHLRKELGCHFVLCEGGGKLGLALLEKGLTRELHLHLAPKILGDNEAAPLFDGRSPLLMQDALGLRIIRVEDSAGDLIVTMKPCACAVPADSAAGK